MVDQGEYPWGTPRGPGIKDNSHGMRKQKWDNFDQSTSHSSDYADENGSDFYSQFGKPGAGACLRTRSGNPKARLVQAADIRIQDNIQMTPNVSLMAAEIRLKAEKQKADPHFSSTFAKDDEHWGQGYGVPRRTKDGFVLPRGQRNQMEAADAAGVLNYHPKFEASGGGGAPIKTPSGRIRTKKGSKMTSFNGEPAFVDSPRNGQRETISAVLRESGEDTWRSEGMDSYLDDTDPSQRYATRIEKEAAKRSKKNPAANPLLWQEHQQSNKSKNPERKIYAPFAEIDGDRPVRNGLNPPKKVLAPYHTLYDEDSRPTPRSFQTHKTYAPYSSEYED